MERRHARAQVAAVALEHRWNPALLLMAIVLGLIVGLGFGLKDRFSSNLDDSYLVLASTLYGLDPSPAVADGLRQRLIHLGFPNPSYTIVRLADQYAQTRDRERQRQAEGLRILGEALSATLAQTAPTATAAAATATAGPAGVAGAAPTAAPTLAPTSTPSVPTPVVAVVGTATPAPTSTKPPAATATPPPPPAAALAPGATGTIRADGAQAAMLRKEPSSRSPAVARMPVGTKVQILKIENGKADDPGIDPKETRWYQVKFGSYTGYVYLQLVAAQ